MKRIISIAIILSLLLTTPVMEYSFADTAAPAATKITKYNIQKSYFTISWQKVNDASGYQLQYCHDRFFLDPKTVNVPGSNVTSKRVTGSSMTPCYLRIRSYIKDGDTYTYSSWAVSDNIKRSKEAIIVRVTKPNGKAFELRSAAKQKVKKYDTLQGGTTYGNTGWFILYNRNVNKCKLVKVNMKKMKVTKVSKVLNVSHGNSVAYNPSTKTVAIAHGPYNYKKVTLVDPNTLTAKNTVTLSLPMGTEGVTKRRANYFKGIISLTYNYEHHVYVGKPKGQSGLIYFDNDLKAIRYVPLKVKGGQLYQGVDSIGDYNLVSQSPYKGKRYNKITVYDWSGKYLSTVNLCRRYEVETIFHRDNALYAGYYRSYYVTYYLDKWRIRVYKGKRRKIKNKIRYTRLVRDNYIFKVTDL